MGESSYPQGNDYCLAIDKSPILHKKRYMTEKTKNTLYRIDRTAGLVLNIDVYTVLFLVVVCGIYKLLSSYGIHLNTYSVWSALFFLYTYAGYACALVFAACILCRIILSPFVKSEEEEIFEQKIEYVLQNKLQKPAEPSTYSPLCDLTQEQEEQVRQVLRDLPSHPNKPDYINLAVIAQYLTALEKMGKAKLIDKHNLRLWVAQITNKNVPASSQFNEAVPSTAPSKVSKAQKELERLLQ